MQVISQKIIFIIMFHNEGKELAANFKNLSTEQLKHLLTKL
jgi:hypothetical protein